MHSVTKCTTISSTAPHSGQSTAPPTKPSASEYSSYIGTGWLLQVYCSISPHPQCSPYSYTAAAWSYSPPFPLPSIHCPTSSPLIVLRCERLIPNSPMYFPSCLTHPLSLTSSIIFLNIPSNSPFLVLNMYCANVIFIFISIPLSLPAAPLPACIPVPPISVSRPCSPPTASAPPPPLSTPSQQLHSAPWAALCFSSKFSLLPFCYRILQLIRTSNLPFFPLFFPSDTPQNTI